jgi:glycosyltransferase involved in cell wall biosynthesis
MDGTIAALLTGVKRIIHTDHARSFPDKWRYMAIEWLMSQFAYKVVGVSEHTSQNLMKYEKISPKKIVTIPNGIDPVPFDITIDKIKKRKELGLPDDGPILGVAVRLSEQKGLTYLIKAMPEIIKKFPTVSLLIAGDGPLKDTLIEETKHLGVQNNVYFLGMRHDTAELLKLFDLYVLPSIWEGLPMIILEAMAAGCPIIATDVGGVGAAVRDGVNGILIHPEEIHTLGQKVVQLLDDERTCGKFAFNTRTIFDEEFSAENMTKMYQQFYLN